MSDLIRTTWPKVRKTEKSYPDGSKRTYYVVDARSVSYPEGRERWYNTKTEAIKEHEDLQSAVASGNTITDAERAWFRRWKSKFLTIVEINEENVLDTMDKVLLSKYNSLVRGEIKEELKPRIKDLCEQYLQHKILGRHRPMREATLKEISGTCRLITERWGHLGYTSLDKDEIRKFIRELGEKEPPLARQTIKKYKVRVQSFCSWVIQEGKSEGRTSNPCAGIKVEVGRKDKPKYLDPEKAEELMRLCENHQELNSLILYMAFSLWAGMRPNEIYRTTWNEIKLEDVPYTHKVHGDVYGIITIKVAQSKTGRPREIIINKPLSMWLKKYSHLKIYDPTNYRKRFDKLREMAGYKLTANQMDEKAWHPDILRKSCATYMCSTKMDFNYVAASMGHTLEVLMNFYNGGLINPTKADKYYQIFPK